MYLFSLIKDYFSTYEISSLRLLLTDLRLHYLYSLLSHTFLSGFYEFPPLYICHLLFGLFFSYYGLSSNICWNLAIQLYSRVRNKKQNQYQYSLVMLKTCQLVGFHLICALGKHCLRCVSFSFYVLIIFP